MFCASLLSDKETFLRGTLRCELVLFSNMCSSGIAGLEFSHFLKSQSYHSKHSIKFIIRLPSESEVFKQTKRTGIYISIFSQLHQLPEKSHIRRLIIAHLSLVSIICSNQVKCFWLYCQ